MLQGVLQKVQYPVTQEELSVTSQKAFPNCGIDFVFCTAGHYGYYTSDLLKTLAMMVPELEPKESWDVVALFLEEFEQFRFQNVD